MHTAKRILERLGIQTLSSDFKANFLFFWRLYGLVYRNVSKTTVDVFVRNMYNLVIQSIILMQEIANEIP